MREGNEKRESEREGEKKKEERRLTVNEREC